MHDEHQHRPVGDTNYEPTDAHVLPLVIVGALLAAVTAVAFLVGYFMLKYSTARPAATDYVASPLDPGRQPWDTDLRLQDAPQVDLQEYVRTELPALHEYGVISDQPEIYHFPIDVAIDYVVDHGLPEFEPFGDGSLEGTAQTEPVQQEPAENNPH